MEINYSYKKRLLLSMLPYWTPLIPPQGLGMLKSFLQKNGYYVKTIDPNIEEDFKEVYNQYFSILEECVPTSHKGNFYNIGHDILHNHMMAAIRQNNHEKYYELVKLLVYYTYYVEISNEIVAKLNSVISLFYDKLESYILEAIKSELPDVVGFSILKGNIPASLFSAKLIKKYYPDIKIVMGGGTFADSHAVGSPNFEALVEETKGVVDKIFVAGQGELPFLYFLEDKLPDKQIITMDDIDRGPIPFHELDIADLSDFNLLAYPYVSATGSLSCPNNCSFCNASKYWGSYKEKPIEQLVNEMKLISEKSGNQLFFLTDSLLNPIASRLATELIDREGNLYYDCYFRVDDQSGDLNNTMLWRKGGMYRTRLGVESGSQKVLDLMNKRITVDQTKNTLYALATAGIKTTAYIVIGHPYETEEDFQKTLDLLEEMKNYIYQAEANTFYYHYAGQMASGEWEAHRKLLYPEWASNMLLFETWTLDIEPLREERYDRLFRFTAKCKELGIPNPYNAQEIHNADVRWKKLHKNAVPSVWEFQRYGEILKEKLPLEEVLVQSNNVDIGDFCF